MLLKIVPISIVCCISLAAFAASEIDRFLPVKETVPDAVFMRRAYLDLAGRIPEIAEAKSFLNDPAANKRAKLIDDLLESDDYAKYQTMKWCDLLRVKSEFPINLWPNAAHAYYNFIYQAVKSNMPLDRFAKTLLLSSGSNFKNPEVNFYRAVSDKTPDRLAAAALLTFMCRDYSMLPLAEQQRYSGYFKCVKYKSTAEWKEEIVYAESPDTRQAFVDDMLGKDNSLAKAMVNRMWYGLTGNGFASNPDSFDGSSIDHPQLLQYLQTQMVRYDFDQKKMYRIMMNSKAYQSYEYYKIRRLDAEVIMDVINEIADAKNDYQSVIPEPFTFFPSDKRTIELYDGSISSTFLERFGRPTRDTGKYTERKNFITAPQRQYLMNSGEFFRRMAQSKMYRTLVNDKKMSMDEKINTIYLLILSRPATADETQKVRKYVANNKLGDGRAVADLYWVLFNSKEFIYRH